MDTDVRINAKGVITIPFWRVGAEQFDLKGVFQRVGGFFVTPAKFTGKKKS